MSSLTEVNLEDVKFKLYEKLKPSGWGDKLKTFILSESFTDILKKLHEEAMDGKRFTPVLKQLFRAFEECPYKDLKVVMIGQDPYPYANVADGIAFSSSNVEFTPPSLKFMFGEIEETLGLTNYERVPDLKRWSNQGILMLNSSLTTRIGAVGTHYELWRPFITFLLDILNSYNNGLIYVFMGKVAKQYEDHVSDNNFKLFTTHPASAAHTLKEKWDSGDVFNQINKLVEENYKEKIIW